MKKNEKNNNNNIKDSTEVIKKNNKKTQIKKTKKSNKKIKGNRGGHKVSVVNKLNIYEKIFNVQQNVAPVFKRNPGEGDSYAYTRERDIIAEVKPMLKEQRLVYTFDTRGAYVVKDDPTKRKLSVRFTLRNVDNISEVLNTEIEAEGLNVAACYTMALKYYFAKLFMIEIEDSLDEVIEPKKGAKKETKKPDQITAYHNSLNLIKSTRNLNGLIEFQSELNNDKFFTVEQKKDLLEKITIRISDLQNG